MGEILSLLHKNMQSHNSNNNYLLFDFVTLVLNFHNKNRFTSFKKAIRGEKLIYGMDTIAIEGWGEMLLLWKIEDWTSILILKEIAYVSNFLFNLVSLIYLKDKR